MRERARKKIKEIVILIMLYTLFMQCSNVGNNTHRILKTWMPKEDGKIIINVCDFLFRLFLHIKRF